MQTFMIETTGNGLFEITEEIRRYVTDSGIKSGAVILWVPHSTAGLTVISRMDDLGFDDIIDEMNRLVPTRVDFKHQFDTPTDASGHVKSAIVGVSLSCIIENNKLQIGSSQGIFFFEFDGPRRRQYFVKIMEG